MATKKYLEMQDMTLEEVKAELSTVRQSYQKLRFDHALKGLDNPMNLKEIRKDIARLHTELRSKELAEASPEQLAMRSKKRARRRRNK